MLRTCRHDQLRLIRADVAECEARLRELRRSEQLLTTEAERDAALRFYQGGVGSDARLRARVPRSATFSY